MNAARLRLIGAVVVVAAVLIGAWMWLTAGRESTDDAQIEGDVTQIAARVGGAGLASAQARLREAEASATKAVRDVDRLRGLLAKDEVSQQQFDATVAAADAAKASADSARSQVVEAEAGIRVAEGRLTQARGGEQQAHAAMQAAATGPQQVTATRAKAASAEAHVQQLRAAVTQAELNLEYATVKAPVRGQVAKKSV